MCACWCAWLHCYQCWIFRSWWTRPTMVQGNGRNCTQGEYAFDWTKLLGCHESLDWFECHFCAYHCLAWQSCCHFTIGCTCNCHFGFFITWKCWIFCLYVHWLHGKDTMDTNYIAMLGWCELGRFDFIFGSWPKYGEYCPLHGKYWWCSKFYQCCQNCSINQANCAYQGWKNRNGWQSR